ncbi:MAG: ornithine cyclodeaminase [Gemmatimonadetes bacterium]|nr:MAG: ornithine cyclodeaminase [Gemmatimonadota bacterium]
MEQAHTRSSHRRRSPTDTCTSRRSPTASSSTDCGNGPAVNVLDEPAVAQRLHYPDLIPAIAQALAALSSGKVVQPVRTVLPVAPHHGFFAVMPAYADGGALGAKLVTFYPQNVGIHTHHALIVMFKAETGEPLAVMDGRLITEMRTAAASAVATQRLARADASVLAILGSGVQAKSHLAALRHARSFKEVRVWSPRNAPAFAQRHGVKAAATAADAVRGADVVVVAVNATTPVLQGRWLAPGTHVNAIGATRPDWRELDDDLVTTARIFVDSREAALRESGDVIAARTEVTEIGAVVAGADPGRRNAEEITLFKSVGVAVEDVAAAALVLRA